MILIPHSPISLISIQPKKQTKNTKTQTKTGDPEIFQKGIQQDLPLFA